VLIRLACLSVANVLAFLRLLVVGDRDKNVEILALRHQIMVLERQLGEARPRFRPAGRAFLAALLHRVPAGVPGRFRLLIRPDRDRDRAQRGLDAGNESGHGTGGCRPAAASCLAGP
jgi:putative transposase